MASHSPVPLGDAPSTPTTRPTTTSTASTTATPSPGFRSPSNAALAQSRRKQAKRRFDGPSRTMRASVQLPARFENVGDEEEDEETGRRGNRGRRADDPMFQKSIYGIFAQAGSSAKLEEGGDSGSDGEGQGQGEREGGGGGEGVGMTEAGEWKGKGHAKSNSGSRFFAAMLKPIKERGAQAQEGMSQSQILPARKGEELPERPSSAALRIRNDAPMMDRKLQAQAKAEMESTNPPTIRNSSETPDRDVEGKATSLPQALAEIFAFDTPEEVIADWPCWYLQTLLLQGHMYITTHHICFYAYLRRKGSTLYSGHLSKQGKRDPRYSRHWFVLKGDILSYYQSSAHPYFPDGSVDLRFAITAELAPEKGKDKADTPYFTITTAKRVYYLRADSATSAREWVKQLQKVVFRSHNDGDSIKISLPIANVVDAEANPVMDAADTVKLSVVDNSDDFALEEYFFTFFGRGEEALRVLSELTEENEVRKALKADEEEESGEPRRALSKSKSKGLREKKGKARISSKSPAAAGVRENVRSTISPQASGARANPRLSGEYRRTSVETSHASSDRGRNSLDRGRRSFSGHRDSSRSNRRFSRTSASPSAYELTDSFATTSETFASPGGAAAVDMSASTMLTGDNAFRAPTLKNPQLKRTGSGASTVERLRKESWETSRSSSKADAEARHSQQPSRAQTEQGSKSDPSSLTRKSTDKPSQPESKLQDASATLGPRASRPVTMPLQHAATLAGYVRDTGKRVGSYLSSSPSIYYDKFTGAMAGGKRHYGETEGLSPEDLVLDESQSVEAAEHERSFQNHFSLPETERLVAVFYASLHRVLPLYGKIYIGASWFCFRSLLPGTRTKIVIPLRDVDNVEKEKGYRLGYPGMILVIRGHEELFFDFGGKGLRDDCVVTVLRGLDGVAAMQESGTLGEEEADEAEAAAAENELLLQARENAEVEQQVPENDLDEDGFGVGFDDGNASLLNFKPKESLRITCLTIGSRGDVQPYIALCKGLLAEGHRPKIATHKEFGPWVRSHGIDFAPVEGNPAELMQLCVEYGMFTPKFLSHTNAKFRGWLDELLESAWTACQNSDLLIESPSAMAGIHIAEALDIPYFRAFTMPWTRTRAYPHAFAALNTKMGGAYNIGSYTVFENIFWHMTARQVNAWRARSLGLRSTGLGRMQQNKIPFLYNFSPSVVVPPLDFSDWIRVTGYWFLDESSDYNPPANLVAFIAKARADGMKLVYIGFGSVVVSDSKALTQHIVDAVLKADVRCILSKGWSDRLDARDPSRPEIPLPDAIYNIGSAPHDWLFSQLDAVVHHGGAGTTGASLRAGVPTIIKPFFGDQFFFATRVEDIGVGVRVKHVTMDVLGRAMWIATHDERMRRKARKLGERIRAENGVQTAINAIYRDLEYAGTLIRGKGGRRIKKTGAEVGLDGGDEGLCHSEEEGDEEGESWTFVESEGGGNGVGHKGAQVGDPEGWERHALQKRWLGGFGGRT